MAYLTNKNHAKKNKKAIYHDSLPTHLSAWYIITYTIRAYIVKVCFCYHIFSARLKCAMAHLCAVTLL
jgi:hypothetical protein